MSSSSFDLHLWGRIFVFVLLLLQSFGLSTDGIILLSFKYSILCDPLGVLDSWNYHDQTPCSWNGVTCGTPGISDIYYRVTDLSLPNSQLLGSLSANLGMLRHLRNLDLSNNSINGSIPFSIFDAAELRTLDLANNWISEALPELIGGLKSLEFLNLSDNALAGNIPGYLTTLHNLTVVSLRSNYFSGSLPTGFDFVQVLDLSSNLITGLLPPNFGGSNLQYLNVSYNKLLGEIPPEFADYIPANATLDLSFNNFKGEIPESSVLVNQDTKSFSGNPELCGKPLKNLCPIAVIPNTIVVSSPVTTQPTIANGSNCNRGGLRPATIVGIMVGDLVGIVILALIFLYVCHLKKKRKLEKTRNTLTQGSKGLDWASSSEESKWIRSWACLRKRGNDDEEASDTSSSGGGDSGTEQEQKAGGALVTVDGEKELELETLLRASAYILGATGSNIMYKAVLEDGMALAVRRIGETGVERFRDFKNQVRVIAKLVHPNLVRIRAFYCGADEKLVIYDFLPNGSLADARYGKMGTSSCHLPWEVRLKIAKGVARGLTYIHEKKHVHGNLKPSNILLGPDMEPKIGDFGLVPGENSCKGSGSTQNFGSNRSTASRDSFQENVTGPTPSPGPSTLGCISPYHAPESLTGLKPNPKWDVYSFGVVLLELLTEKVIISDELFPGAANLAIEEKKWVLRMTGVAIRADVEANEGTLLELFKLGLSCISLVPRKRPQMKEVLQVIEKFPSSSFLSSFHYTVMDSNNEKCTLEMYV